jgi:hypothetical protein
MKENANRFSLIAVCVSGKRGRALQSDMLNVQETEDTTKTVHLNELMKVITSKTGKESAGEIYQLKLY